MRCTWLSGIILAALFSAQAHAAGKEWTILVFINGHNDLDAAGTLNVNQMETAGSSDQVNVVVQLASLANPDHTTRILVQKDSDINKITSPVVQDLGRVDMGDPNVLKEFLLWGMQNYPAKHFFAVVWNHGSGWHLVGPRKVHLQDISFDDLTGNAITTEDLGKTIRQVSAMQNRKIDIYGSDACLMAMGEIAAEMDGSVDYFVGSEELEPENGWPYDVVLTELNKNPAMAPRDLASLLARKFVEEYPPSDHVTLSGFDMAKFAAFENAVRDLGSSMALLNKAERKMVLKDVKGGISFNGEFGDLGDFVSRTQKRGGLKANILAGVQHAIKDLVFTNFASTGLDAQGITLWMPTTTKEVKTLGARYKGLLFDQHTQWLQSINAYLN